MSELYFHGGLSKQEAIPESAINAKWRCQETRDTLRAAANKFARQGTMFQLTACLEFSLIADRIGRKVQALVTLDVPMQAIKGISLNSSPPEHA